LDYGVKASMEAEMAAIASRCAEVVRLIDHCDSPFQERVFSQGKDVLFWPCHFQLAF
jgi:hypothetical protein